jgi:signal transduction histidine kinase
MTAQDDSGVCTVLLKSSFKFFRDLGRKIASPALATLSFAFFAFGTNLVIAATNSRIELEGTVNGARPISSGQLELEIVSGTNRWFLEVQDAAGSAPVLYSRVRFILETSASQQDPLRVTIPRLDDLRFVTGMKLPLAQNVAALRTLGAAGQHASCVTYLKGIVLAVSSGRKVFAFQDATGVVLLEPSVPGRLLAAGQQIILEANCVVEGDRVLLLNLPVVDNNDMHTMTEKSGAIFLSKGKHPLRLAWFNQALPYGLEVYFQGPDLLRQRIPNSALFRQEADSAGNARWVNGLDYRSYEGTWLRVPDFSRLIPAKQGTAANFDTSVAPRFNDVGLEFSGYVEAPSEGLYLFTTISDDGSLLFIDEQPPSIEVTGTNSLPVPNPIAVHQNVGPEQDVRWSQVEGKVSFASEEAGALALELSADVGRMRVEVADSSDASPQLLLNRRVRATGICLATRTTDGQSVAGKLLSPGMNQIQLVAVPSEQGSVPLSKERTALPLLATIEQIKRLTREDWQRGYPVKIQGVVTTVLDSGFFIQDSTGSIYARWRSPTDSDVPRIGDFWDVEGTTFAEFAPNIQTSRATRLGTGTLPEPFHPTWDQLINGSLDTEYVEVQGIITAVESNEVTLLTRSGKLSLQIPDVQPQELAQYENVLVRVRGCVIPVRDIHTQQVVPGQLRFSNAAITVDEPAPSDPFAIRLKHAADLLRFDLRAGAFERVKVAGQIVHKRERQLFMMDGTEGLRIIPKSISDFQVGDLVEVVGFSDLGGASPTLREAIGHRIGNVRLPDPMDLPPDGPLSRRYDATVVRVRARLVASSRDHSDQILELQAGTWGFIARLQTSAGLLPAILPGSLLELTGVYAGQGSDLASGREIDSFELLLNSPSDVQVLSRPSWWTARHTLTVLGGMAFVTLAAFIWIALLRRQVEERSNQLASEVRRHEHTERQRELEAERTRIARDLHDDLGASLTQIRFLSAVESRDTQVPEDTRGRMKQVSEKSNEMVAALDEIVWAVNPANDTLPNLANYLCHFAEEFFRPTAIRCRLDIEDSLPPAALTSEVRHNVYLAVREAVNNVVKHSQATEVWLRIHSQLPAEFSVTIEDNGRGFTSDPASSGNGLANMRERLKTIGGRFELESAPGRGVTWRLFLTSDHQLSAPGRNCSTPL